MRGKPYKIMVVEDDTNMAFMLRDNLEMAGYDVTSFADGQTALSGFSRNQFDLCLLDVMLPKKDGFNLATDIRKLNIKVPIVFLTAKSLKEDRIQGFKAGADDYLTKPFSIEELLLRIQSILKRVYNQPSAADDNLVYSLGKVTCNFANQQLVMNEQVIDLTQKETKLLHLFCLNKNKVINRDIIQKAIWEDEGYFVGRSMDVFISRLRKILSIDPSLSITNIHGVGYKLEVNQSQSDTRPL
jgi:two-component system, OmpR family, response regulator